MSSSDQPQPAYFLEVGRERTLGTRLQLIFEIRACDVITADYSIIMSRSRVIMSCMTAVHQGNHVKFARFVFLAVSEEAQTSFFFVSFNV